MNRKFLIAAFVCVLSLLSLSPALAEEELNPVIGDSESYPADEAAGLEALIQMLEQKGVIAPEEAQKLLNRLEGAAPDTASAESEAELKRELEDTKRELQNTQYKLEWAIQKAGENQGRVNALEADMEERVGTALGKSSWAQRIRWGGDIRLRYQGDYYDADNAWLLEPRDPTELMNTHDERQAGKIRARLFVKATDISDPLEAGKVEVGVRLTTGNEKTPVSTNETLGDYFNRDAVYFDWAYLKWTYKPFMPVWNGRKPSLALTGGRFPRPWFSSDLVWDDDISFEGLAAAFKTDSSKESLRPVNGFLTIGAFPLQEVEVSSSDKWLYGAQAGVNYTSGSKTTNATVAVAYYDYSNIQGVVNDPLRPNETDYTAPLFQQKGNTLYDIDPTPGSYKLALASEYKELAVTGKLDLSHFHPIRISLLGDYVVNLGFDRDEVERLTGETDIAAETQGFQVGLEVGYPQLYEFGTWKLFFTYKYLERDAVLDAFTDSDFHLGGTNAKGWIFGGSLGLGRGFSSRIRYLTSDEISGPPLAIDTVQVDVSAKY